MKFNGLLLAALVGCSSAVQASPNVLAWVGDSECVNNVTPAVNATAGSSVVNNPLFLDYDNVLDNQQVFFDANNPSATTILSIATHTTVNHAPYSYTQDCHSYASGLGVQEPQYYRQMLAAGALLISAAPTAGYVGPVLQLASSAMVVTSPNSLDGNKGTGGPGSELFLSVGYLGLQTHSDSSDTGVLAGIAVAVGYAHPTFNVFDVHAVFRQTASNWSGGWNSTTGFGTLSYSAAAGSISTIYLQAPNFILMNFGSYATITIYPFRQTRRAKEVVYVGGTWPAPSTVNELTAAQIAAAGGTLIYTSNGTDVIPQFNYAPAVSGTATFHALTLDSSGNGSRVESFNAISSSFTLSVACYN